MHNLNQHWFLFQGKALDLSLQSLVWTLLCRSWSGGQILPGDTAAPEEGAMSPEREVVGCAGQVQAIWTKNLQRLLNTCSEACSDSLSLWKPIFQFWEFSSSHFVDNIIFSGTPFIRILEILERFSDLFSVLSCFPSVFHFVPSFSPFLLSFKISSILFLISETSSLFWVFFI